MEHVSTLYGARLYTLRSMSPYPTEHVSLPYGAGLCIVVAIVLAGGGQLVVFEVGQHFLKLQEEALAGLVAVGIHVIFR